MALRQWLQICPTLHASDAVDRITGTTIQSVGSRADREFRWDVAEYLVGFCCAKTLTLVEVLR